MGWTPPLKVTVPPPDPSVPPAAVAAVSFGAFMVGAVLVGGLWFVHGRTGQ